MAKIVAHPRAVMQRMAISKVNIIELCAVTAVMAAMPRKQQSMLLLLGMSHNDAWRNVDVTEML